VRSVKIPGMEVIVTQNVIVVLVLVIVIAIVLEFVSVKITGMEVIVTQNVMFLVRTVEKNKMVLVGK
jgi:hypothetical protein